MKLLKIFCIREYKKEVMEILKHSGVKAFSYHSIRGFKNEEKDGSHARFVSKQMPTDSLLFSVFIEDDCKEEIFKRIGVFNQNPPSLSKIHFACCKVDQSNF